MDLVKNVERITKSKEYLAVPAHSELSITSIVFENDGQAITYCFYDEKKHMLYPFSLEHDTVVAHPPSRPVQDEKLKKIKIDNTLIPFAVVKTQAVKFSAEHYPKQESFKNLIVLLQGEKTIWQYVAMTKTLETILIKFDAHTLEVLEHSIAPLIGKM